jgi:ABC-type spermidine/putrescine transport system permease subunit II
VLLWVFCGALILFLVAPIVIVMITSFNASPYMDFPPRHLSLRWYTNFFTSTQWIEPTLLSLRIALVVTVSATVLGTLAAIGTVRGRFRGRQVLKGFFVSPMVVPVVVLAVLPVLQRTPARQARCALSRAHVDCDTFGDCAGACRAAGFRSVARARRP